MTEANFQVQRLKRRTGAAHFQGNEAAPPLSEKSNRMHEAQTGAGVLKPRADSITATLAVRAPEELASAMAAMRGDWTCKLRRKKNHAVGLEMS